MVKKLIEKDSIVFMTENEVIAHVAKAEFMYDYPITPQNIVFILS